MIFSFIRELDLFIFLRPSYKSDFKEFLRRNDFSMLESKISDALELLDIQCKSMMFPEVFLEGKEKILNEEYEKLEHALPGDLKTILCEKFYLKYGRLLSLD